MMHAISLLSLRNGTGLIACEVLLARKSIAKSKLALKGETLFYFDSATHIEAAS
jgi:hypothetical protein